MTTRLVPARSAWKAADSETLALVLAGGKGTRLGALTRWDAKPAVPFGGTYRNIDFTLSNCVNSGLRRIAVLTQYKSQSLLEHLQEGWSFLPRELGEFVDAWPAQQRMHDTWYDGTADAVRQNVDQIRRIDPEHVLVLAGDHVYAMDYRPLLAHHRDTGADVTVACVQRSRLEAAGQFGVLDLDERGRVVSFAEKPELDALAPERESVLVSMGVYVFNTRCLLELFVRAGRQGWNLCDFGGDVLPLVLSEARVVGHVFRNPSDGAPGYWRDVGTVESYWRAHMELVSSEPPLDPGDPRWPVRTRPLQCRPARIVRSDATAGTICNVLLSPGCVVTDATIRNSVLSPGVTVEAGAVIEDSVLLPKVSVGRGAVVSRAVVAEGVSIPARTVVCARTVREAQFEVTEGGVTLVHTAPGATAARRATPEAA
jgi:glucose-1-phosphate adenylyltransferase